MGDKRQISLAGRIPNNLCRYSALKEMENNLQLSVGCIWCLPSNMEKGVKEKNDFIVEKTWQALLLPGRQGQQ